MAWWGISRVVKWPSSQVGEWLFVAGCSFRKGNRKELREKGVTLSSILYPLRSMLVAAYCLLVNT